MLRLLVKAVALVVAGLAMQGCAGVPPVNNLTPLALQREPLVTSHQELGLNSSGYRSFTVVAASALLRQPRLSGLLEKQMLFALRNGLEARGYRFVSPDGSPDFVAMIDGNSEYKQAYVPPQAVSVPIWNPGRSVTTSGSTSGSIYTSGGWGTYSSQSSSSGYVPGYFTYETYIRPGATVGWHFPMLSVFVFDGKTQSVVWSGSGVGTSVNPEFAVSSQGVLGALLTRFPGCQLEPEQVAENRGRLGVAMRVLTVDGANYVPAVTGIAPGSPAAASGVKQYDLILSVNGVDTTNKPFSEVRQLFQGEVGSHVKLVIWRLNKRIEAHMVRAALH